MGHVRGNAWMLAGAMLVLAVPHLVAAETDAETSALPEPQATFQSEVIRRALAEDEVFEMTLGLRDGSDEADRAVRNELLSSQSALEILAWLADYLDARAGSDPEELGRLTEALAELPAATVRLVLLRLNRERDELRRISTASRQMRDRVLQSSAASRSRSGRPTAPTASRSSGSLAQYYNSNPYGSPRRIARRGRYRTPRPLITSRQVARFTVYRSLFGRRR